jgi:hypothetical protein
MAKRKGKKAKYIPTVTIPQLKQLAADIVAAPTMLAAADIVRKFERKTPGSTAKGTWRYNLRKLERMLRTSVPKYSVFADKGNMKLPYVSWSTLPGLTCPGAGDCLNWCYSFTAWRYPAAFCRQVQNTMLIIHHRRVIIDSWKAIKPNRWVRLYVDGDIDSESTALFWFNLLRQRPDLRAYGYSKSWQILAAVAGQVPHNYVLNLSSGSIHDTDDGFREQMLSLPFVRGEFIATRTEQNHGKAAARFDLPEYHRDVRASAGRDGYGKVFSCPGRCGDCLPDGPACGLLSITIPIAIGIH